MDMIQIGTAKTPEDFATIQKMLSGNGLHCYPTGRAVRVGHFQAIYVPRLEAALARDLLRRHQQAAARQDQEAAVSPLQKTWAFARSIFTNNAP